MKSSRSGEVVPPGHRPGGRPLPFALELLPQIDRDAVHQGEEGQQDKDGGRGA